MNLSSVNRKLLMNKTKTDSISSPSLDALQELNHQTILHPATSILDIENNGSRLIKKAKGIYVEDNNGNQLIDGIAGLWCCNLGHGRKELGEAMITAVDNLDYFHTFNGYSNEDQIHLANELIGLAPGNLSHVFFGSSGSDANDTLIKIAWQYHITRNNPTKRKIISRWQAYHGTSISTASLTGLKSFHKAFHLPLDFALHTETPHYYINGKLGESEEEYTKRLLTSLTQLIDTEGADNIAAFIGEPIMGAGGVIPPPKDYWTGVQRICRDNDILLIADEVVSGYGRTGAAFASEHYGIEPDMMATAKGLTSGVFPMSAAYVSKQVHDVMREASGNLGSFSHGYTYSGHPVGCAVALKVIEIIKQEKIIENSNINGLYLHAQLNEKLGTHPKIGEIRGKGLLAAIQLMKDKEAKIPFDISDKVPAALSAACLKEGLIARPLPSVGALALSPPLIVTQQDIDLIVSKLVKVFNNFN